MVSHYSWWINVFCKHNHAWNLYTTRSKTIMEFLVITMVIWFALAGLVSLMFFHEGTKGIEKEPYYGRKTGKLYTAKATRKDYRI